MRVAGLSDADIVECLARVFALLKERLPTEHHSAIAEVAYLALEEDKGAGRIVKKRAGDGI